MLAQLVSPLEEEEEVSLEEDWVLWGWEDLHDPPPLPATLLEPLLPVCVCVCVC